MGGEEDPKDGGAVAGAVFGAVFIYIVSVGFYRTMFDLLTHTRASSHSADCKPFYIFARADAAR